MNYETRNQHETNKSTVLTFYDRVVNQSDFVGAALYLGPRFLQYNPDEAEGLRAFMEARHRKFPHSHVDIKRVFANGDYMIIHGHVIRARKPRKHSHRHFPV